MHSFTWHSKLSFLWLLLLSSLVGHARTNVPDLPILYYAPRDLQKPLVLYVSGDGGWNSFSRSLVDSWVKKGHGVIALDSRKYFWKAKTPEQFGQDIASVLSEKLKDWKLNQLLWVGYSFGADVSAFIPSNIPSALSAKIKNMVLISPSASTDFEIKLMDMAGVSGVDRKYKVAPVLQSLTSIPVLCVVGKEEDKLWMSTLTNPNIKILTVPGDHRFDYEAGKLLDIIEARLR